MAKRQERLHGRAAIEAKAATLPGMKVTLVLKSKAAFFVEILALADAQVKAKNMRLQKQNFDLNDIEEIIIDKIAE